MYIHACAHIPTRHSVYKENIHYKRNSGLLKGRTNTGQSVLGQYSIRGCFSSPVAPPEHVEIYATRKMYKWGKRGSSSFGDSTDQFLGLYLGLHRDKKEAQRCSSKASKGMDVTETKRRS